MIRWQRVTVGTLLVGYSGYYLCRSNLSVAAKMLKEPGAGGLSAEALGAIMSVSVLLYALGKLCNGVLTDFLDGRRIFLCGMIASVICTFVFGLGTGAVVLGVAWSANRFVQSMGWPALTNIAARWFPASRQAMVMGVLSLSYLFGDAVARLLLGGFIKLGVGWRGLFFLSGGLLGAIALASWRTLKSDPADVGLPDPDPGAAPAVAPGGETYNPWAGLWALLCSGQMWLVCLMNCALTLIRETFNNWTPTYLSEVVGLSVGDSALGSVAFPLTGGVAALAGGWLSDRCGGRHGRVMLPSLLLMVVALAALSVVPLQGRPVEGVLLLAGVALFLMVPYSFCSGVLAIDLGGKRASATAAGLIDTAGYLGGAFAGWGVAVLATRNGWPTAFGVLAVTGLLAAAAAVAYIVRLPRRKSPANESGRNVLEVVTQLLDLLDKHGGSLYGGEAVTQREHALQAASAAEQAHAAPALIAAALLHDIGHLLPESWAGEGAKELDLRHEEAAARRLANHFPPDVVEPVRLHVAAKRYLSFAEPSYRDSLSPASVASLRVQGGPFTADEARAFLALPHAQLAVALRRWDEAAKVPGLPTPDLRHYSRYLEAVILPERS
jgi:OPA family glycerol-3-phosphate transporter-like MFS transporter